MVKQILHEATDRYIALNSKGGKYTVYRGRNVKKSQLSKGVMVEIRFHNSKGYIEGVYE